jgi:hypothetical protein
MKYNPEDLVIIQDVLDVIETEPTCDEEAVEEVARNFKRLKEVNGTHEAELIMESIRLQVFNNFCLII